MHLIPNPAEPEPNRKVGPIFDRPPSLMNAGQSPSRQKYPATKREALFLRACVATGPFEQGGKRACRKSPSSPRGTTELNPTGKLPAGVSLRCLDGEREGASRLINLFPITTLLLRERETNSMNVLWRRVLGLLSASLVLGEIIRLWKRSTGVLQASPPPVLKKLQSPERLRVDYRGFMRSQDPTYDQLTMNAAYQLIVGNGGDIGDILRQDFNSIRLSLGKNDVSVRACGPRNIITIYLRSAGWLVSANLFVFNASSAVTAYLSTLWDRRFMLGESLISPQVNSVSAMVSECVQALGRIDVLVNNA